MKFSCSDIRGKIETDFARDAAEIFAEKLARRHYGRRAIVGAIRHSGNNRTIANYEAFVGLRVKGGGVHGKNIYFYVYLEK